MLVHLPTSRRQDSLQNINLNSTQQLNHHLPSPPPSASYFNTTSNNPLYTPSAPQYDQKLIEHYLASTASFSAPELAEALYMPGAYDLPQPDIRIQQSTPIPQLPTGFDQSMSQVNESNNTNHWNIYNMSNGQLEARSHQRATSTSSIQSNGSAQYSQGSSNSFAFLANSDHSPPTKTESSYGADEPSGHFSNHHLPTPSHTPTQDTFMASGYQNFAQQNSTFEPKMAAHAAMKHALIDHHAQEEDLPGFSHSSRHSVSSFGGAHSPATPHTTHEDDFDEDGFKVPSNGEIIPSLAMDFWLGKYLLFDEQPDMIRHTFPKLDRTMSDAYQDELYNPNSALPFSQAPKQLKQNPTLLSPFRNVVSERLQAANKARSQSPSTSGSRGVSPFRQNSPLAPQAGTGFGSPNARLATAQQAREFQKAEADAQALRQHMPQTESEPKTISPKDALLEYNESEGDSKMPLFPEDQQFTSGEHYQDATHYDANSEHSYGSMASSRGEAWTTPRRESSSNYSVQSGLPAQFTFVPPSIPGMHGLSFSAQGYRSTSAPVPEQTPEFPAHLTSMESSASDAGAEPSSQGSIPESTVADRGTYTCTYHGCTLRFETPQKLQKHKREGHRQNNNGLQVSNMGTSGSGLGSGMTSAALLARNSQAGPHKCERINPTTGKPCNTVFSRPYDLTRHEDTIHNARKQKVRCALCIEDKTFSRNDALTRHMRVVHPEVDFPGKHRRRGGRD
ncbi:hypothetical protein M501DRAFT_930782 [Patellaria atrata CBS 101060]|uniref:C2H2-type domain-containing protein n=1 Tax=Patellaria atrata CBS 101060 TaxID=1346257 RepID=A0A9P4VTE8_9PEZI|nr:hypothetical protein M501DRAFT_930782 [Patellaria atrata CBS 101060]